MVQTRDKKSHLELPPDFVVSTNLHVTHDSGKQVSRGGPIIIIEFQYSHMHYNYY